MTIGEAIIHFGSRAKLAKAAGISRAHVYNLVKADSIPINIQCRLEIVTNGALKADPIENKVTCKACGQDI